MEGSTGKLEVLQTCLTSRLYFTLTRLRIGSIRHDPHHSQHHLVGVAQQEPH